ncbi:MAG: hypothetical protein ACMVY4_14730 [Minwuia sp.]|uniref:hypothetical protein n=1 Tax=Minwuia sp. TaxID=2493630 RepID=UPI003A885CC0
MFRTIAATTALVLMTAPASALAPTATGTANITTPASPLQTIDFDRTDLVDPGDLAIQDWQSDPAGDSAGGPGGDGAGDAGAAGDGAGVDGAGPGGDGAGAE